MEQQEIDEILSHISQKFEENVPGVVKMVVRRKANKLQSFEPKSLPDSLRNCSVENLINVVKYGLETGKLKL